MAKSLRSRRERRLREFKRIRYAKKELERLKKCLGITDDGNVDVSMVEAGGGTVTDKNVIEFGFDRPKESERKKKRILKKKKDEELDSMDVDDQAEDKEIARDVKKKGTFPVWMHQRQIRRIKHFMKKRRGRRKKMKIEEKKKKRGKK